MQICTRCKVEPAVILEGEDPRLNTACETCKISLRRYFGRSDSAKKGVETKRAKYTNWPSKKGQQAVRRSDH